MYHLKYPKRLPFCFESAVLVHWNAIEITPVQKMWDVHRQNRVFKLIQIARIDFFRDNFKNP